MDRPHTYLAYNVLSLQGYCHNAIYLCDCEWIYFPLRKQLQLYFRVSLKGISENEKNKN